MKIAFTGGGSAGHVIPNLVIIDECKKQGFDVFYIGSKNGIERTLIKKENIPYFSIPTGKLRRYFSFKNFTDIIKIFFGIVKAFFLCRKIKPNIIFSKGGFVSFPLVFAAWLNKIPIIIHESDLTIGLANKLSFPFATKICVSFLETKKHIKNKEKVVFTGNPIRKELYLGNRERGLAKSGFTRNKPVILVYAGSLGSIKINKLIRDLLPKLINDFQIIHVCGKGNTDPKLSKSGYTQFEYISDFSDFIAASDIVISRAGSNTIFELLALKKLNILIPLSSNTSRGDQIENATYFADLNLSCVIFEDNLVSKKLYEKIIWLNNNKELYKRNLEQFKLENSSQIICDILKQYQ